MEPQERKAFETYCLEDAPTNTYEVNMDVQKGSDAKDTSGPCQCEYSNFSSSTKTNLIQHVFKICFDKENTLL